jgi:hypothetical protein
MIETGAVERLLMLAADSQRLELMDAVLGRVG